MRPLVIVDLECWDDPTAGWLAAASMHRHCAPERPLTVVDGVHALPSLDGAAGILVTGSNAMVGDVDWALPLGRRILEAAEHGVPVLGVCFAHQMLAACLGAPLGRFEDTHRGVPQVTFAASGPFALGAVPLVHTHRDHVLTAPAGMHVVGTGGFGGVAALAHDRLPVWTCQGHPEFDHVLCRRDGAGWDGTPDAVLDTPGAKDILRRFGALLRGPESARATEAPMYPVAA